VHFLAGDGLVESVAVDSDFDGVCAGEPDGVFAVLSETAKHPLYLIEDSCCRVAVHALLQNFVAGDCVFEEGVDELEREEMGDWQAVFVFGTQQQNSID
jgi:hypothetical protein